MPNIPISCVPFSATFSPLTSVSGCNLWLDGKDLTTLFQNTAGTTPVTTSGQTVQCWKDKSSSGNNATSSSSSMTYGTNNIYFPGSQTTGLSVSPTLLPTGTTDSTWFFVLNTTSTGIMVFFAQGGGGDLKQFYLASNNLQSDKSGVAGISGSTSVNTGANIIFSCLQKNSATAELTGWQNGNQFATKSYSFNVGTPTAATIGTDLGSLAYTGYIAEIIVYNSSLSTPNRQNIEGYLAQKWSATGLPAGHPGLTSTLYTAGSITYSLGGLTTRIPLTLVPFATAFNPLSITSCVLWLDGKDPAGTGTAPSAGATVSTWADKSTSAKNATAGGTPTYVSGGGINFNGSSYFTNTSFAQNLSQRSIFIVMQETTRTPVGGVFPLIPNPSSGSDYDATGTSLSIETQNGLRFYSGTGYTSDIGNTSLLVKAVYNDNMNVRAGTGFVNGNSAATVTAGYTAGTCSGYGLGARWIGGAISLTYPLNGVIFEIMFFNSPLGVSDRQNIEGYLAQKWGVTASLPVNHPGLTQTFYSATPLARSLGGVTSTILFTNKQIPITTPVITNLLLNLDTTSYSSGSTWTPAVGNVFTVTGTLSTVATPGGTALSYNGSSYAQDGTGITSTTMYSYTLDVWFYAAANITGSIIGEGGQANLGGWNITLISVDTNTINVGFWNGSVYKLSVGSYTANTWTHVSYSYNSSTNVVLGYVNGVYVSTGTTTKQWPATTFITTGGGMNPYANFVGRIGAFKVYNSVLSAADIKQNYNSLASRYGLGLI